MKAGFFSFRAVIVAVGFSLVGCTPPVPVTDSREVLWQRYGGKPMDQLLMDWGAPIRETRLNDGSRMVTYSHSTHYEDYGSYGRESSCEATFLAKSPLFKVSDVAMEGDANECRLLSQGKTGEVRLYAPPAQLYYAPPYHRYRY